MVGHLGSALVVLLRDGEELCVVLLLDVVVLVLQGDQGTYVLVLGH